MKKIIGIVLLILAMLSVVNVMNKLSGRASSAGTGNRSYDTGKKMGMVTTPIVLGAIGLWLLLASGNAHSAQSRGEARRFPVKPVLWTAAIAGGLVLLLSITIVIGGVLRKKNRFQPPPSSFNSQPAQPATAQQNAGPSYSVGERVKAQWAGKLIPGTITAVNPGGFSVMVQLEDSRFPQPIVLSTRQLQK